MGDKHLASWLASGTSAFAKGQNARSQLDLLARVLKKKGSYFRKYELRAKESKVNEWDIVNLQSPWPTVVVLLGGDGGQSHSVTLVGDLVFDSNCTHAMHLNKETLDWCCNCETGFKRASYALHFWHRMNTLYWYISFKLKYICIRLIACSCNYLVREKRT
jgi:hypothetical protein